ncbi:hypothetical protein [Nocardioides sp. NPDC006273]|uniref:hypothetical protein n=1 Tax=Nocardioides sp. NPDC006273 TaxID=3155598 RepID=UPI0033ADDF87
MAVAVGGMIRRVATKDTRTYDERKAVGQDSEALRRHPRRAVPAPVELWELVEAHVRAEAREELSDRELGKRVNAWVRARMADGVGRPDLAKTEEDK